MLADNKTVWDAASASDKTLKAAECSGRANALLDLWGKLQDSESGRVVSS